MREIKFRAVIPEHNIKGHQFTLEALYREKPLFKMRVFVIPWLKAGNTPDRYTGLNDINDVAIFEGDILQFNNGDKFAVACEGWLEFYDNWIGEPECDDQVRDFYRIARAEIIGNIHEKGKDVNN